MLFIKIKQKITILLNKYFIKQFYFIFLTTYFTASRLFTFIHEGMMYIEFNSITLFTILYSRFLNCAKDVSTFTVQATILE